jgi:hypothetical protein
MCEELNSQDREEKLNTSIKPKPGPVQQQCHSQAYFLKGQLFSSEYQRALQTFVSLNINSFHHLMDEESTDFKGHSNFVHVLELQSEE